MTLATLNRVLASHDLALPNLGDIDAQTVAGAIQTGTHGTGRRLGCLSTFVSQLTLVTASGSVVTCSRTSSPSLFAAAVVGLGAFGVITTVTLECVPAFVLRAVERPDSLSSVLSSYESLVESNDHFEFFWFPYTSLVQTKTNNRVDVSDQPLPRWREWLDDSFLQNSVYGVACRVTQSVPSLGPALMKVGARALTARTYTAASYEAFCTPRRVRFHETEYGLPRAALPEAFAAVRSIIDSLPYKLIFPVEVRCAAGDDFWLSHGYGRDTVYVAVQQYVGMPYEELFRAFERVCLDLGGRPHWGKMTWATAAELRAAYPKWDDWAAERRKIDPGGTFGSTFVDRLFPEIVEDGKKT
jgi:L-gulonolactone oxidase